MGQGGVGAEFCFTAEGNPMLALLVLIKEPVSVPDVPKNPANIQLPRRSPASSPPVFHRGRGPCDQKDRDAHSSPAEGKGSL